MNAMKYRIQKPILISGWSNFLIEMQKSHKYYWRREKMRDTRRPIFFFYRSQKKHWFSQENDMALSCRPTRQELQIPGENC